MHALEEGNDNNLKAGKILNAQNKKQNKKNIKEQKIDAKAYHK